MNLIRTYNREVGVAATIALLNLVLLIYARGFFSRGEFCRSFPRECAGSGDIAGHAACDSCRADRYLRWIHVCSLQRHRRYGSQARGVKHGKRARGLPCRRRVWGNQWWFDRLSSRSFDCRHPGDNDRSARRPAMDDPGLMGRRFAPRLSIAWLDAGRIHGDDIRAGPGVTTDGCRRTPLLACRQGDLCHRLQRRCRRPGGNQNETSGVLCVHSNRSPHRVGRGE